MIAKARTTTHRGDVSDFFGQAHVTMDASSLEDVTEDLIMSKVSDASGSSVRVLNGTEAGDRAEQSRAVSQGARVTAGSLEFADSQGLKDALWAVRDGGDWCLMGYAGSRSAMVSLCC